MEYRPYTRQIHYYETDQMAIVHHSNYIRWFEEARLDLLEQAGFPYPDMEQAGLMIPVVDVSCQYHIPARYADAVTVQPILLSFNGVRMNFRYEVRLRKTGELLVTGTSSHCFVDTDFKPLSIKRKYPALYNALCTLIQE